MFESIRRSAHIVKEPKEMRLVMRSDGTVDPAKRVLLVFPIFTHVLPEAFAAFAHMLLHTGVHLKDYKPDVMVRPRELLHAAMNHAADLCIQNPQYDGLIAFDDDCLPPPHLVVRMLAHFAHGQHVVAAVGYMRNYPHTTTVGRFLPDGSTLFYNTEKKDIESRGFEWVDDISRLTPNEHGLASVDFCGMPAIFMSREVLMKVEKPAFGHTDRTGAEMTHDIFFCNRVRDAGYTVQVDVTMECDHIGPSPLINRETRAWARAACEHAMAGERKVG